MKTLMIILILSGLVVAFLPGCGDDGSGGPTRTPLAIIQTSPDDKAQDVNLNPVIQVWFNQALDEASVTWNCLQVETCQNQRVEYDDVSHSIRLYLKDILESDSTYVLVIGHTISGAAGDTLAADIEVEFTTGPADCAHLEDYFEPNDDIQTAAEIELDTYYTCLTSCGGDERVDFYKFTVESPVMISANALHSFSWGDTVDFKVHYLRLDGEYYHQINSRLAENWGVNNDFTFYPGTYILEVGKVYDDGKLLVYNLMLEVRTACDDDQYEDNDFIDEAAQVTPGLYEDLTGCVNDRDFYALDLTAGQTLTGVLTQVTDFQAARYLKIFDPDGTEVASESLWGRQEPITTTWTATETGTHYLCTVWGYYGIKYDLEITVTD